MGKLSDNKYMFTLMTAIVKAKGGELRISEKDLVSVTTSDVVTLLYDKKTNEIVLRCVDSLFTANPKDDEYEN